MQHPLIQLERFVHFLTPCNDPNHVKKLSEYQLEVTPEDRTLHKQYTGKQYPEFYKFDGLSLLYGLPEKLSAYEKKEVHNDPGYFESAYALIFDTKGQLNPSNIDGENANREELLKRDPSRFMWAIKYWTRDQWEEEVEEDFDDFGVYCDDSFTGYDIILVNYDSKTIQKIMKDFLGDE